MLKQGSGLWQALIVAFEDGTRDRFGLDTCVQGFVWRDAFPGHHVCVTPAVRLQCSNVDEGKSVLELSQQPISLLLMGTLLGSLLIPYSNDRSNRHKLKHEERVKVAILIIEQSHETDRRLSNLIDFLVLFRKDHNAFSKVPGYFEKEQYNGRKSFNDMYLSFNSQAWWWHWNVKSESSLSALATPDESKRMSELARQYSEALGECVGAVTSLWDPLLKNHYNPSNHRYDELIKKASEDLTKSRKKKMPLRCKWPGCLRQNDTIPELSGLRTTRSQVSIPGQSRVYAEWKRGTFGTEL
jgi:hypothetical protein